MMSAFANSLHKPERFDLSVRKFRSICAMHGLQMGSRTDLPVFMQKLMDDRHLAMDFWAFVGKLSSREGGEFSDDQVLAVVTEGVAGELSEEDDDSRQVLDNLRAMLSGVDVQGPGQSQVEIAPFPQSETRPRYSHEERKIHAVEPPPREPDSRSANGSATIDEGTNHKAKLPPPVQLDEALLRLELTRLVKQYFESIDKSKLEAPGEGVPVASPSARRSLEDPDPEDLAHRQIGKSRLVLEPIALSTEDTLVTHPVHVPFEDYAPSGGYRQAILLLGIVIIVFQGGFAAYAHRAPLLKKMSASIYDTKQKTVAWMKADLRQASAPAAAPEQTRPAPQAEPSEQSVEQAPLQGTSTPPPATTSPANTPAQTTASAQVPPRVDSGNTRNSPADRAVVPVESAPADNISNADLAGAVRVSPAVMDDHLIASRVPVYPEAAKIDGIEGSVVMQAIISTDGTVKRVHVVQGDSHLRSAAVEAAYKRLYRPYFLNGRPVDVATTITVDFELDR
jgi:TonB family protein